MGFLDQLFGSNAKSYEDMSDTEIIRRLKRKDLSIAQRAKLIQEAKARGLDIPSLT